jgi:membrane-associated phospholipid phosphatase
MGDFIDGKLKSNQDKPSNRILIFTRKIGLKDKLFRLLKLLLGFLILTYIFFLFSKFIPEEMDWRILLAVNPDHVVPVLDNLMVFITDFSIAILGLLYVCWEIAYQLSRGSAEARKKANKTLRISGVFFSALDISAMAWSGYERPLLLIPLALLTLAGFWIISSTFTLWDEEKLKAFNLIFWAIILSVSLTIISAELIIKNAVARPRPLSESYSLLNQGLRKVPGEVVESGYSYVAGHSSFFFAMITPIIWYISRMEIKLLLLFWALLLAFSRVYLAAHFPYGSVMGSALGFLMAVMVMKYSGLLERVATLRGDK